MNKFFHSCAIASMIALLGCSTQRKPIPVPESAAVAETNQIAILEADLDYNEFIRRFSRRVERNVDTNALANWSSQVFSQTARTRNATIVTNGTREPQLELYLFYWTPAGDVHGLKPLTNPEHWLYIIRSQGLWRPISLVLMRIPQCRNPHTQSIAQFLALSLKALNELASPTIELSVRRFALTY